MGYCTSLQAPRKPLTLFRPPLWLCSCRTVPVALKRWHRSWTSDWPKVLKIEVSKCWFAMICLWYWSSQDFTNWNLKESWFQLYIKWLVFVNIIHLTISQSDRINKWYIYLQNVGKSTSPINPIGRIYLLLTRTIDSQIEAADRGFEARNDGSRAKNMQLFIAWRQLTIPFTRGSQQSKPPQFFENINTLPETNKTSPLKSCLSQKAKDRFPTIHFHGQALAPLVLGSVSLWLVNLTPPLPTHLRNKGLIRPY